MFYLINYKKNEKEKKFMLPCMAAVAIAMFVGAKVIICIRGNKYWILFYITRTSNFI